MSKSKRFLIVVLVIMFCGGVISAQPFMEKERGPHMMPPPPGHICMLLKMKQKDLKITDDQLEKINSKAFALEEKTVSLENQANLLRLEMKKLMMNEKNKDYNKIKSVMNQLSDIQHTIFIENLKTMDAIKSLLTPEQQQALEKERHKRFKDGLFPPPGMRGGMRGMEGGMPGMGPMGPMGPGMPGPGMGNCMGAEDMKPGPAAQEEK